MTPAELAELQATVARQYERVNRLEAVVWHLGFGRSAAAHSLILRYAQGDEWKQSDCDVPAPDASDDPTIGIILPAGSVITPPADALARDCDGPRPLDAEARHAMWEAAAYLDNLGVPGTQAKYRASLVARLRELAGEP